MPKLLRVRALSAEETQEIGRLARSRTAPARVVERARIMRLAAQGRRMPGIAAEVGVSERTVRRWVERFHAQGWRGWRMRPAPVAPRRTPRKRSGNSSLPA